MRVLGLGGLGEGLGLGVLGDGLGLGVLGDGHKVSRAW